eukprot:CAMPEP_0185029712 /NCGR_PEP_ID=MMETSP1103-20130426/16185_1 /TAXON_ID=36769 /ORGANISM="Paraphysomonas bandaiensis, Strain Caron Lab Isolate" /LENGTH=287 /DNA_ID=CAMNT_0027564555 /DNA_START=15 /DNA_END=876 /DNA_ORIENTATION=-
MTVADGKKTRSKRVERILKKREPLLIENTKKVLVLRGHRTSQNIIDVLKDVSKLSKPHTKSLSRKNDIHPLEDCNSLEFLCDKNDCSLFALGSHSKKRPHNLVLGRLHNKHVLDVVEFGVDNFRPIESFAGISKAIGSKPAFVFVGDNWEVDSTLSRVQNLIIDFFRGDKVDMLSLKGLDHVIACFSHEGVVLMRLYALNFKKSGSKIPLSTLAPMGPFMDLTIRRTTLAPNDMFDAACRIPKELKAKSRKNVTKSGIGESIGRVHMKKQNFDGLPGRKIAVLARSS